MVDSRILDVPVRDFVSAVAAKTPTPGGGSVAGVVGAMGVALGEMSLNFTRGKKKFAEHEPYYAHLAGRLEKARRMFQELVADDVSAYELYQAAGKEPEGPAREAAAQTALAAAIDVPRQMSKLALAVLEDLKTFLPRSNRHLVTDLISGAVLAGAVARLSDFNVRVNVPQAADKSAADEVARSSSADLKKANELVEQIQRDGLAMLS